MKTALVTLLFTLTFLLHLRAQENREEFDFNFDGHMDYRIKTLENGKADRYDVFIFNPVTNKYVKNSILSGTISPCPDEATKEVRCIWPGGHSGALYSGSVYRWNGKAFELDYTVRQSDVQIDGKTVYICAKARMEEGRPVIFSIERVDPK